MSRRLAEGPSNLDAISPGDTVIGHEAAFYKDGSLTASHRPRPGVPGQGASQEAPTPQLPMSGVANAAVGRHLARLREQVAGMQRDLERGCIGAGGNVVEHLVIRQREMREHIAAVQAEIERIGAMDDLAVRRLAFDLGAR